MMKMSRWYRSSHKCTPLQNPQNRKNWPQTTQSRCFFFRSFVHRYHKI